MVMSSIPDGCKEFILKNLKKIERIPMINIKHLTYDRSELRQGVGRLWSRNEACVSEYVGRLLPRNEAICGKTLFISP